MAILHSLLLLRCGLSCLEEIHLYVDRSSSFCHEEVKTLDFMELMSPWESA